MQYAKMHGFDGNFTYGMENISTNKRNLMNPDELLKMDNTKEIVMVRGKKPFVCDKYVYMEHPNFNELEDLTVEEQIEKFKTNMEVEDNRIKERKEFYSFDDF
jgi:type IV secretion system protein VirD4